MKIYTKTGDRGTSSLFGGKRVDKDSLRLEAYGTVDELNSLIGFVIVEIDSAQDDINKKLLRIQSELFILGTDLATPVDTHMKVKRVTKPMITKLEREIDDIDKNLPKLKNFILPGGGCTGAKLHLARTITRRAERTIVTLGRIEKINQYSQIYINRLSDWFFVLARYVNKVENKKETIWIGRRKESQG